MNGLTLLAGGGGGGGAPATNWATFSVAGISALTPGEGSHYAYAAEDFWFPDWSGNGADPAEPNDFAVEAIDYNDQAYTVVRSTRGGVFQATFMAGSPVPQLGNLPDDPPLVLDAAYQHTRYLWLGAVVGEFRTEGDIKSVGVDMLVPILTGLEGQNVQQTATSSIGYTPPGGVVLSSIGAALVGGVGDDSVPINRLVGICCVYQIG